MNRRNALRSLAISVMAALGVSACGQKGPLFSPQDKLDELERKRDERAEKKAS